MHKTQQISQFKLIIIMGLVMFLDIYDFMIIMPLGYDYASYFGIDQSSLGLAATCYTITAAISGISGAIFFDKFDRKKILIITLIGLSISALIGSFANSYKTFLFARLLAGTFGGTTASITMAIITDLVPINKRGYVIGKVMSAFAFAATIGVPFGLMLSRNFSWHMTMLSISLIGFAVVLLVFFNLPNLVSHLNNTTKVTFKKLFFNKHYNISFLYSAFGMIGAFMIIPYISAFLQLNLNYARSNIELLYLCGGIFSFLTVQLIGNVIDKKSSSFVTFISLCFISFFAINIFILQTKLIPIIVLYTMFMMGMSMRNIANSALVSKIPQDFDKAGFMSIISVSQNIASGLGAYFTSMLLYQESTLAPLENMNIAAAIAIMFLATTPLLMRISEKNL